MGGGGWMLTFLELAQLVDTTQLRRWCESALFVEVAEAINATQLMSFVAECSHSLKVHKLSILCMGWQGDFSVVRP